MVRVSVIMAVYNAEQTLSRSIESIINQTYTNWEFILCDDCSTDSSYEIMKSYEEKYPDKIVILRNETNSKLPYSLNRCLEKASGEFVARMDADDESLPERFERQIEFLESHPEYEVVGTSMVRFDEKGEYDVYRAVSDPNPQTLMTETPFCHATIMMRKSAFDALGGYTVLPRTIRGQDIDLWFRFYAHGYKGTNLHEALYRVCEDRNALKRRKLIYDVYAVQTRFIGFRLLKYPKQKYYLAFLPLISRLVPRRVKLWRRRRKDTRD